MEENPDLKYPSEEQLRQITIWPYTDYHGLMEYVRGLWNFDGWGFHRDGEIYFISTGGWSGNEEIIDALKFNIMFWVLYWHQSRRGGHYIFAPSTFETIEQLESIEHGDDTTTPKT